jgi:hypothetical protein
VSHLAVEYLVEAIQEERLEEARRARLARSLARGRRRGTLERFSVRRALAKLSPEKTEPVCVPSTNPSVCPS